MRSGRNRTSSPYRNSVSGTEERTQLPAACVVCAPWQMVQHNRHWSLARQAERAHVATREERADDIPTGDRQVDARGMRRVAVDRDARRTQAPQVVAGDRFERGGRRLVVGALD